MVASVSCIEVTFEACRQGNLDDGPWFDPRRGQSFAFLDLYLF